MNTTAEINAQKFQEQYEQCQQLLEVLINLHECIHHLLNFDNISVSAQSFQCNFHNDFFFEIVALSEENVQFDKNESCGWTIQLANEFSQKEKPFKRKLLRASSAFTRTDIQLNLMGDDMQVPQNVFEELDKNIQHIEAYQEGNISKVELSKRLLSADFMHYFYTFYNHQINLQKHIEFYMDELELGKRVLQQVYQQIFNLNVPIVSKNNVKNIDLQLLKNTSKTQIDNMKLTEIENMWKFNLEHNIIELKNFVLNLQKRISNPVNLIRSNLSAIMENIEQFNRSLKMDTKFYM